MHSLIRTFGVPLVLILLLIVGVAVRTVALETLPAEIHRDEAAIGYNAYSLLLTARDEHGQGTWPAIFRSFGDYKLPGLIYITMASIKVFGLSVWSVRITTAVLASFLIPITYGILRNLFKQQRVALLGAALLTFSYWHTFLARTAYEPIAALTVSSAALLLLLKGRTHWQWLFGSLALFILSFTFYNLPLLLAPVVLTLYVCCFWTDLRKALLPSSIAVLCIALSVVIALISLSSITSAKSKTTFFNNPDLQAELQQAKDSVFLTKAPESIRLLITNKYLYWSTLFVRNYLQSFSFDYLFFSGGKNPWHNLNALGLGNFNVAALPFILIGFWTLVQRSARGSKAHLFLLFYVLLSPIPDALTIDAPVTNRLMDFHYALLLTATLGVDQIVGQYKVVPSWRIPSLGLFTIATYFTLVLWFRYWYLHPVTMPTAWNEGMRSAALQTKRFAPDFRTVYINADEIPGSFERISTPYIYFAFYGAMNPVTLHTEGAWDERGGFYSLISTDTYRFEGLPLPWMLAQEPILYVTRTELTELDPHFFVTPVFTVTDTHSNTIWRGVKLVTHE